MARKESQPEAISVIPAEGQAGTESGTGEESPVRAEPEGAVQEEAETNAGAEAEAKAKTDAEAEAEANARVEAEAKAQAEETVTVQLRHKTQYARYRCAGLALRQKPETYRVTGPQLEKLRHDPWVVVEEGNTPQ
jgi:predicted  nucleic acid-binding Zn-ribbon protein